MTAEAAAAHSAPAPQGAGAARRIGRSPLLEGLVGSAVVTAGSYGVGWLVSVSDLNRIEALILLRTEPAGVVASTGLLTLGCWIMLHAWLRLPHDGSAPMSLRTATRAAILWALPQLVALPIFSRDVFAYLNQGRLVLAEEDPYTTGVSALENWFQLGTDVLWAEDATPYGPLFLWYEAAVMHVAGESPDLALLLFRAASAAGVVLLMVSVPRLAALCADQGRDVDPARAQWLTAANPLLIISFVSSAHNDALMIGLAVASFAVAAQGRGLVAVLLMTASIGVKPITIVLLPFLGLLWAVTRPPHSPLWRRVVLCWAATLGIAAAALLAVGLIQGPGFGWMTVMAGTGSVPWAPLGILDGLMTGGLMLVGAETDWTLGAVRTVGRALTVAAVLVLMLLPLRGDQLRSQVLLRSAWAMAAVVVLSPLIQPWYLLWLLPLFAVIGIRNEVPFALVAIATGFFLAFGAADQLSVYPFVQMDLFGLEISEAGPVTMPLAMSLLSWAVSAACAAWLLCGLLRHRHRHRHRQRRRQRRRGRPAPAAAPEPAAPEDAGRAGEGRG